MGTLISTQLQAQETVFSGLGNSMKRADKYFDNQSYQNALDLYLEAEKKGKAGPEIYLKLAQTCNYLYRPDRVVYWFEQYLGTGKSLSPEDAYVYAEALTSQGAYKKAIAWLRKYQQHHPENQTITEKIWRLQNIHHLYADSSYFEVKPMTINTDYAEFGASYSEQGLIFVSNRQEKGGISQIDRVTGQPFQSIYQVSLKYDSVSDSHISGKPKPLFKEQGKGLHLGTVSMLSDSMLFTRNGVGVTEGRSVLQLFWATRQKDQWVEIGAFQYNSVKYSISHPCFSVDGNTLYFVSDMPGGRGGSDIYRCERNGHGWSPPVNLGSPINTMGDETAPFLHGDNVLYFASDGHGGFGGLDVFKISLDKHRGLEVENMGYPINSPSDDFGLILNEEGTRGFLASNRKHGGFNDDLYEIEVDLQTYPLIISGFLRYHDPDWSDPTRLQLLIQAKITLIDNSRGIAVYETESGENGAFLLEIPYSSQFKLEVEHKEVGKSTVSLDIPKNRKLYTNHQIVVVKEKFKAYHQGEEPKTMQGQPVSKGDVEVGNKYNRE